MLVWLARRRAPMVKWRSSAIGQGALRARIRDASSAPVVSRTRRISFSVPQWSWTRCAIPGASA